MGAWIETCCLVKNWMVLMSRPSWARGLKPKSIGTPRSAVVSRALHGRVD